MALFLSQICKPRDLSKLTRFFEDSNRFCKGNKIRHIQMRINKNASHDLSIVKRLGED